jgi:hypothetical protein
MEFVRSRGAASIKEIKDHFHTDSASVRHAIGFLYFHDKIWLIPYSRGIFVTENTGKKGPVNIASLRKQAGVVNVKRGPKPKKPPTQLPYHPQISDSVHRIEEGREVVDFHSGDDMVPDK